MRRGAGRGRRFDRQELYETIGYHEFERRLDNPTAPVNPGKPGSAFSGAGKWIVKILGDRGTSQTRNEILNAVD